MEEAAAEGDEWTLNIEEVFENYASVRKWNDNDLLGFIYGNDATRHITNILFSSPTDLVAATELVRFAESSFSSDIYFLGILILKDVEYNFDIESLSILARDPDNLLRLYADVDILKNRRVDEFLDLCDSVFLRISSPGPSLGFTAVTTIQLDLHIKLHEPIAFKEDLSDAIEVEMSDLDSMCFLNSEQQLLLGFKEELNDISGFFKKKGTVFYENIVTFTPLRPVGVKSEESSGPKLVPVVKVSKGLDTYVNIKSCISAFTVVSVGDSELDLVEKLRTALSRALYLVSKCIADSADVAKQKFVDVDSYAFVIGKNLICAQYPHLEDESVLRSCRSRLHRVFNLPFDRPRLRPSQSVTFYHNPALLRNPHEHISGYKPLGEISVVRGFYDYHHYLQDGYDDCGWGCAYRSMQSIWSWFIHQGFTEKPVPSHKEIQQSLVDCGDKEQKFVGSKQWIGSMELGFCLEHMLGFEYRIITTNSGNEVAENARQLAVHFKTVGTPVMIGGGMLAHTILGIDFNESTGECAFLVLDPHYTGEDIMQAVVSKGWCGWKPPSFWKPEHFYNLLVPLPPTNVI